MLAEKFRDFELLIDMCIDSEDLDRLTHYIEKYIDEVSLLPIVIICLRLA